MKNRRYTTYTQRYAPLLGVFSLAFLVRLAYNLTAGHNYIPKDDAALYNNLAQGLLVQHCYCLINIPHANVSRAPLWPIIIAIIYAFTGVHDIYPRLFYCFLGSGTCLLVYFFARSLFGRRIALFTGFLAAVYTGLFLNDGWLFSESLYTFLVTALTYSLFLLQTTLSRRSTDKEIAYSRKNIKQRWLLVCGGLALGLASLTRPNGPLLFSLVVLWGLLLVLTKLATVQAALRAVLVIGCIALALILPWTYRNYRVTHAFIPVALGAGDVLVGAYNDTVLQNTEGGVGFWVSRDLVRPPISVRGHDDWHYTAQDEKRDTDHALQWMTTHLRDLPYLWGWHFLHMWSPYTLEPALSIKEYPERVSSQIISIMMYVMAIPVFVLAATGLVATWQHWKRQLVVVYLMLAFTVAQNIAFYANMRFRAPIEPLLVLLVGGTLWWLTSEDSGTLRDRLQKRKG